MRVELQILFVVLSIAVNVAGAVKQSDARSSMEYTSEHNSIALLDKGSLDRELAVTAAVVPAGSPSAKPFFSPTVTPILSQTTKPIQAQTTKPIPSPTTKPVSFPTTKPTLNPTRKPSIPPTPYPTRKPSIPPTPYPTRKPSFRPTLVPTSRPTRFPTAVPTKRPTSPPTRSPTASPTGYCLRCPARSFFANGAVTASARKGAYNGHTTTDLELQAEQKKIDYKNGRISWEFTYNARFDVNGGFLWGQCVISLFCLRDTTPNGSIDVGFANTFLAVLNMTDARKCKDSEELAWFTCKGGEWMQDTGIVNTVLEGAFDIEHRVYSIPTAEYTVKKNGARINLANGGEIACDTDGCRPGNLGIPP